MYKYEVGKPFAEGRAKWPEAVYFNYDKNGLTLTIFARRLSRKEIEAVRNGQVELAVYENQPVIFFLYKIKGFGKWSDAPYTIHVVAPENRPDPEKMKFLLEEDAQPLNITLVNADTGLIEVLRFVSTSTAFSVALNQAILRQMQKPYDQFEYNQHIQKLYARYTSDQMLVMAEGKCRVGE